MQAAITHRNPHFSLIKIHPELLACRSPIRIKLTAGLNFGGSTLYSKTQVLLSQTCQPCATVLARACDAQPPNPKIMIPRQFTCRLLHALTSMGDRMFHAYSVCVGCPAAVLGQYKQT